ncbi:MAG TPA: type III pantothenate kinase, partial [Cyclobacteriaceae bacterium]|nr:type III pantothenate kinase [Cyclobacteriaceae bacterium]
MNIVIDQGNSSAKVGIFDAEKLIEKYIFSTHDELFQWLHQRQFRQALVSSVRNDAEMLCSKINCSGKHFILSHKLRFPVKIKYETPHTLGMDRLAAVCAAQAKFPNENCLVIDCGTAITYDVLDAAGNYLGGAISAGLQMKFKALHTFTSALPLAEARHVPLTGVSTTTCIQSGVINGSIFEIEGFIARYQSIFKTIRVLLCGGDTSFFENKLKEPIFVAPDLVLYGLNRIL